jgi:hypothetical protein
MRGGETDADADVAEGEALLNPSRDRRPLDEVAAVPVIAATRWGTMPSVQPNTVTSDSVLPPRIRRRS